MDIHKPVENPDVVKAMEEYRNATSKESEDALIAALTAANYLVILDKPFDIGNNDENGAGTLKEGQQIAIPVVEDAEGNLYLFGFTDWRELQAWSGKPHQVVSKALLLQLTGKSNVYTVEKETAVMLGTPANYPHAMTEAITKTAKTFTQIKKLFLFLMRTENGEDGFLVVVEGTGNVRDTFDAIGGAALPMLPKGMFLDLVPANESLGQDAIRGQTPFYKRGLFSQIRV